MKLFYSYIGRLHPYLSYLWRIVKDKFNKITRSAITGHCWKLFFRHFLILCFVLFSIGGARSQSRAELGAANSQSITPLNIGDSIPDELWDLPLRVVNHPDGKETITLSDYKDKLIILDFWATYCSPCIKNFPKLNTLQNEFSDKIKVLAVTVEDTEKISKFFSSDAGKEYTYVNSVVNDKALSTYFLHRSVPHIAWISPRGKVLNTTQAEDVNQANIQAVLDNHEPQMMTKVDIDRERPLFLSEHFSDDLKLNAYSIFIKGYYPGLPSGGRIKKTKDGKVYGRQITNLPMMDIYSPIIYDLFTRAGDKFSRKKRSIIEVSEPAWLNPIKNSDGSYKSYNFYNYELIVPEDKADSLFYYMLEDLNRYSAYIASIEKRKVDCFVLVRTAAKDKIKSKGGKGQFLYSSAHSILSNRPISYLLTQLNSDTTFTLLPIIDETAYTENVDIEISGITDFASLKRELNRYDLDLVPAKRSLNMFVLKDK